MDADEYALDLNEVINYIKLGSRSWIKGTELSKSKTHFVFFGIAERTENFIRFEAACLRSTISDPPVKVQVVKDLDSGELRGSCACKANIETCKHISGLMLKLQRKLLSEVTVLSRTELEKQWGKVSACRAEAQQPSRLSDLCHVKAPKIVLRYKALPTELSQDLNEFIYNQLLEDFPHSVLNKKPISVPLPQRTNDVPRAHRAIVRKLFTRPNRITFLTDEDEWSLHRRHSYDENAIEYYYQKVDISQSDAIELCLRTRFQNTHEWLLERMKRITAFNARSYFTYAKNKKADWNARMESVLFSDFYGNRHTRFGKAKEGVTKKLFGQKYPKLKVVHHVGLIVNARFPWFAFSPDGFAINECGNVILLEGKALAKGRQFIGLNFCKRLSFLTVLPNKKLLLKENSEYYAQIQMGLAISNLDEARLILYVHKNKSVICVKVTRNEKFIDELISSLTDTYFTHYLPFLSKNEEKAIEHLRKKNKNVFS